MRITYDAEADAAYVYLTELVEEPETRTVTNDVYMDFDEQGRLVGIEVLDASKLLDLTYLAPLLEKLDETSLLWHKLRRELVKGKRAGIPVETIVQHVKNWIEEVGDDYVVVRSERTGKPRKITQAQIADKDLENHKKGFRSSIVRALRDLGGYS